MKKASFWMVFSAFVLLFPLLFSTVHGQSTSVSLEPTAIDSPFVELENGEIIVTIGLTFTDISELKEFSLILTFDGNMLEYYTDHAGDWGYSGSRSTNPQATMVTMSGELKDERIISGSGTFYTFSFNVTDVGSSQIFLQYLYLEDKSGSEIQYTVLNDNVTINVTSLENWVNTENTNLTQTNKELLENYTTLENEHAELLSDYDSLLDDFQTLTETHDDFMSDYTSLEHNYDDLQTDYSNLKTENTELTSDFVDLETEHNLLTSDYNSLESNYTSLSNEHEQLSQELAMLENELSTNTNVMYTLTAITVVVVAAAVYFIKMRK